jgi:hypothetical protein
MAAGWSFAKKSSKAAFWDDIRRYDRNMFPHIGELCRISSMPPHRCGGDAVLSLGMRTPFTTHRLLAATARKQSKILRRANSRLVKR